MYCVISYSCFIKYFFIINNYLTEKIIGHLHVDYGLVSSSDSFVCDFYSSYINHIKTVA